MLGIRFIVIGEPYYICMGESSVKVEYSARVCSHNYSLCCDILV